MPSSSHHQQSQQPTASSPKRKERGGGGASGAPVEISSSSNKRSKTTASTPRSDACATELTPPPQTQTQQPPHVELEPIETLVEAACDPAGMSDALAPMLRFRTGFVEDKEKEKGFSEDKDSLIFQWEPERLVIVGGDGKLNHGYAMVVLPPDFWYQYLVPPHGAIDARMDMSVFIQQFNLRRQTCDAARFVIRSDAARLFIDFGRAVTPPSASAGLVVNNNGGGDACTTTTTAAASKPQQHQQRAEGEAGGQQPAFSLQTQRDMELPFIEVDPDDPDAALQVVRVETLEAIGMEALEATNDADYQFSATITNPKRFETAMQCISTNQVQMSVFRNPEGKAQLLIHLSGGANERKDVSGKDILTEGIDLEDVEFPEDGDAFECFFKMLHLHKVCKMPKAHKLRIHLAEGVPLKLRWTLPRHAEFTLFLNQCGLD